MAKTGKWMVTFGVAGRPWATGRQISLTRNAAERVGSWWAGPVAQHFNDGKRWALVERMGCGEGA